MAYELNMPDIGEGLTEAEIISWIVETGATVAANEPLVEVETDKAVVEIPSPRAGVLLHQGSAAGSTIRVGDLLAVIGTPGEIWRTVTTEPAEFVEPEAVSAAPVEPAEIGTAAIKAMPLVRRLAKERDVDLAVVVGTGAGGKITRQDVEAAAVPQTFAAEPAVFPAAAAAAGYEGQTLSALRKTIARNLTQSWQEIPHVTVWRSVDATRVLQARKETGLLLESILVKVVLSVLAEFPDFNASFDGSVLQRSEGAHVGIAVDTEAGLMVPVVRNAETMNLRELTDEIERITLGARERTLGLGELGGGTFTLSNVGAVGGGFGTPIIPYGTTAIVSIGRAEDDVMVRNKAIVIAPMFSVSLSFDHRVIDGAKASQFLRMYSDLIESYGLTR